MAGLFVAVTGLARVTGHWKNVITPEEYRGGQRLFSLVKESLDPSLGMNPGKIYPPWFQSGHWPLGLMPSLALLGAVLGSLGGGFALRRYLKV